LPWRALEEGVQGRSTRARAGLNGPSAVVEALSTLAQRTTLHYEGGEFTGCVCGNGGPLRASAQVAVRRTEGDPTGWEVVFALPFEHSAALTYLADALARLDNALKELEARVEKLERALSAREAAQPEAR